MSRDLLDDGRDDEDEADLDGELRAALAAAVPEPPLDAVDWDGLQLRITAAATPLLARHSSVVPARAWWQPLAEWSPHGIPLAAAAALLLMLGAGQLRTGATPAASPAIALFWTVEEELAWGTAAAGRPLLADVSADGVLDAALFDDGEEW
jgi:hypothetical protein